MSLLDDMDDLEKQLADLEMCTKDLRSPGQVKKIPPPVPPKVKKAQPQVPQSSTIGSPKEPSYSSKVSSISSAPVYSNMPDNRPANIDYANRNHMNRPHPIVGPSSYSNNNLQNAYSNISYRTDLDNQPQLPHVSLPPSKLHIDPQNNDDLLPPPSPVSSNYSELVRATSNPNYQNIPNYPPHFHQDYATYGASQASTYESIYEPINPLPQSAQSARSVTSAYNANNYHNGNNVRPNMPKEAEVDALTNMLVNSMSDGQDPDIFGICVRCGDKVIGETSGCTAMGNMYHVQCFSCYRCNGNLQGKPFYAVEGQPYCERDYMETLEKCSVCDKVILDRILRATGKPYHPACFSCVVCGKSLDGIPFTVDAANQIHCIEDFHKKFAPRCCVCNLPIMPEDGQEETVRVVALDRSFHVKCYRCEDCGLLLSSENEGRGCYPLDDHILCKGCNAHRVRMLTNVMTTDL